jgi:hypothetical protein
LPLFLLEGVAVLAVVASLLVILTIQKFTP